ncbi:MAG: MFS transporter, partial [Actinobacteria bacterium]|nr:MFS transporter [Actinomycetota bacterium]
MTAADVDTVAAGTRPAADDPKPGRHLIFAIVSLAIFMMALDQTIVATALGSIQRDLHTQVNWSTWTISVYSLGQIVILPLAGRLSDQFGRKRIFVAAVVVFTLASLCCGLANDIYVLVALRAVQSIGGGAFMPSATGIVSDQYGRDRDRAIGLFSSIVAVGGIVGPIFGGLFVTYWTWRGIFFINVPIGIALLILTLVFVPDVRRGGGRRLDSIGSVLLCLGLLSGMFAMALIGSPASAWRWPTVAACAVVAVGGLVCFVRRSARVAHPVIPVRLLRGAGFGLMNGINFVWGSAIFGFSALVPLYAEERYGLPSLGAGTLLTARAVGMAVVTALAAMALRRTGYRRPILVGFIVTAAGLFLLSIAP